MIEVKEIDKTSEVIKLYEGHTFGGGHYCHNLTLLSEVKDGLYRFRNILRGKYFFCIVFSDKEPIMIAPIRITNNICTVMGSDEAFDYVDFFYRNDLDYEELKLAFEEFFMYLKKRRVVEIRWRFIPCDSISRKLLSEISDSEVFKVENVYIHFETYQTLIKSLSKSTRQNLRTAANRLEKDGRKYRLITNYYNSLDEQIKQCISIYHDRQKEKYGKNILNLLLVKSINFTTRMMKKNQGLLVALEIDGNIAAFMFGYINMRDKSFEVPKLAVDPKYGFYSPGMLLVSKTIEFLFNDTDIRNLDLCRGTEEYKMKMGGEIYNTYSYVIRL